MPLIELPDGRALDVKVYGDTGPLVVVHHGTPGGPIPFPGWADDASDRGLRLVMYARPGYASSSRQHGRSVAAAAADTAAIADALGADRFLTWGFSGGGPHALACAALLGDRVIAAGTVASVGPYDAPDLDFLADMGQGNIDEFGLVAAGDEAALATELRGQQQEILAGSADDLARAMAPHLTEVDAREVGVIGETMLAQFREGGAGGVDGWVDDDLAFVRPWGFDVADIRVPVLLLQGRQDAMVPYGHGEWLAAHIPGVHALLSEEDGHLTLLTRRFRELHEWLRRKWDAAR